MLYYFDSSAAIKRYAPEKGSEWIKTIAAPERGNTIAIGQIGVVEIAAALSKKVRTRELARDDYEAALLLFLTDVRNEEYNITQIHDRIIELAVDLTRRHPLRGYDAIHLATASVINSALLEAEGPQLTFVSADKILCEAAQAEGLLVSNSDEH